MWRIHYSSEGQSANSGHKYPELTQAVAMAVYSLTRMGYDTMALEVAMHEYRGPGPYTFERGNLRVDIRSED